MFGVFVFKSRLLKFSSPKRFLCSNVKTPYFEIPPLGEDQRGFVFTHTFSVFRFDNLPEDALSVAYKRGDVASPALELWVGQNTNLVHVPGQESYDFKCPENGTKYQMKTFGAKLTFDSSTFLKKSPDTQALLTSSEQEAYKEKLDSYCDQVFIIADLFR